MEAFKACFKQHLERRERAAADALKQSVNEVFQSAKDDLLKEKLGEDDPDLASSIPYSTEQ